MIDGLGNLYGVCTVGGVYGLGTVYEVSLVNGQVKFSTLYAFQNPPDGALPYSGLVFDRLGNLYGTTYYAGANDLGTVYKLTRGKRTWTETVLYSLQGGTDGANPISSLVADASGCLYGTTSADGNTCGCGTIFQMTRGSSGNWTERSVYRFPGAPHPGTAYNGMVRNGAGHFYGATVNGGTADDGTIYEFIP